MEEIVMFVHKLKLSNGGNFIAVATKQHVKRTGFWNWTLREILVSCAVVGTVYFVRRTILKSYLFKSFHIAPYTKLVKRVRTCVSTTVQLMKRPTPTYRVIGMDCEMTSDSTNGGHPVPAILQLASPNGFCAIFQLKAMERYRPKKIGQLSIGALTTCLTILRQVLEDPTILKVGVAVTEDSRYLEESYGLLCKGCLDVRYIAQELGIKPRGLGGLAIEVLEDNKVDLTGKPKNPWESWGLTDPQIEYAAQDACLGVRLFWELNKRAVESRYNWFRRLFWDEKTYWKHSVKLWEKYIGKPFVLDNANIQNSKNWKKILPLTTNIGRDRYDTVNSKDTFPKGPEVYVPECASPDVLRWVFPSTRERDSSEPCIVCARQPTRWKEIVPLDYNLGYADKFFNFVAVCTTCFNKSRKVDYALRLQLTKYCGAPYPDYKDKRLLRAQAVAREIRFERASHLNDTDWLELRELRLAEMLGLPREKLNGKVLQMVLDLDCWVETDHGKFVQLYFEHMFPQEDFLRTVWGRQFYYSMQPSASYFYFGNSCIDDFPLVDIE